MTSNTPRNHLVLESPPLLQLLVLTAWDVYHLSWSRLGANFSWSWFQISFKKKKKWLNFFSKLLCGLPVGHTLPLPVVLFCFFSRATLKTQPRRSGFYWTAKCSCILGMSLKLKVVLGDSHKPARAIPWLILSARSLWSCVTTLPQQRICKRNTGVQFARVKVIFCQLLSIKQRRCLEQVGSGPPRCRVLWWLGRMQQISCFCTFLWMNSRIVHVCVGVKGCELCTKTVCEPTHFGILGTEMFFSSFFCLFRQLHNQICEILLQC